MWNPLTVQNKGNAQPREVIGPAYLLSHPKRALMVLRSSWALRDIEDELLPGSVNESVLKYYPNLSWVPAATGLVQVPSSLCIIACQATRIKHKEKKGEIPTSETKLLFSAVHQATDLV